MYFALSSPTIPLPLDPLVLPHAHTEAGGITQTFKADPLQKVEVFGTFNPVAVSQNVVQREIEEQLRELCREDLPSIIHSPSQRWVTGRTNDYALTFVKPLDRCQSGATRLTPDARLHPYQAQLDDFATHPALAVLGMAFRYAYCRFTAFRDLVNSVSVHSIISGPIYIGSHLYPALHPRGVLSGVHVLFAQ